MKYFILAALAAVCAAQIPARCYSPREWTATAFVRDFEKNSAVFVESRYVYDEVNQRKARFDKVESNTTTGYYHVIELYREKVFYMIDAQTKECQKHELKRPFIPHSVTPNATFQGDYIIGTNAVDGAGVEIEVWTQTFKDEEGKEFHWMGQFTRHACIPFVTQVDSREDNYFFSENFVDVVAGITDPNDFIPPSNCPQ